MTQVTDPHFEFNYTCYRGPWYDLRLSGSYFELSNAAADQASAANHVMIYVSQRKLTRHLLDIAEVAKAWKRHYRFEIVDGVSWSLSLKVGDLNIKSEGLGDVPDNFKDFVRILQRITGQHFPDL